MSERSSYDGSSMGSQFTERRAAAAAARQQQPSDTADTTRDRSSNNRSERGSSSHSTARGSHSHSYGGGGGGRPGRSSLDRRRPRGGRQNSSGDDRYSFLPLERGSIVSLRDNFGFIYCADRPEEVFFHFSQVIHDYDDDQDNDKSTGADMLKLNDEVEFRIGSSSLSSSRHSRSKDEEKNAAYQVKRLKPPDKVVWEIEEEPGKRFKGWIEKVPQRRMGMDRARGGGDTSRLGENSSQDGIIRIFSSWEEDKFDWDDISTSATNILDAANADATSEDGESAASTVRFTLADYTPVSSDSSGNSSSNSGISRPARNDLVEFSCFTVKRTNKTYARNIVVLQSTQERQHLAREASLLKNATLEHGIVVSLKKDYGFLQSNKRREHVYFHYSHIDLEKHDNDEDEDLVLKEGQDMEFLVVRESNQKASARRVRFLPKGSVVFQKTLAEGVTGVVTQCPHLLLDSSRRRGDREDGSSASAGDSMTGVVKLSQPIVMEDDAFEKENADDGNRDRGDVMLRNKQRIITEVKLRSADVPGGIVASYSREGGSGGGGLWIRPGDTLLFNVVQEVVDGTCRVGPTTALVPAETTGNSEESSINDDGAAAEKSYIDKGDVTEAVRLLMPCLAGRAEGVISSIRDNYGFIQFAERNIDVYFRYTDVFPSEIQEDIRRNMHLAVSSESEQPLKLAVGSEVQFDLSLQGPTSSGNTRSSRGTSLGRSSSHGEKENFKAQRLCLLPPSTVLCTKELAKDLKGVINKKGNIELEEPVASMELEERHPLVCKMIASLLDSATSDTPTKSIVYYDLQSGKEDSVVMKLVESLGGGKLQCSYLPVAKAETSGHPGRLCISLVNDETEDEEGNKELELHAEEVASKEISENVSGDHKQSKNQQKQAKKKKSLKPHAITVVPSNKRSLPKELQAYPPGPDDTIICDIIQIRRTGAFFPKNLRIVKRAEGSKEPVNEREGVGVVCEVMTSRQFGFIAVLDENANKKEMLYFHLSSVQSDDNGEVSGESTTHSRRGHSDDSLIRKGDEVKFDVGSGKNGKRVAENICILPSGTLKISVCADKNACSGYVLLEPSFTTLSNTPLHNASQSTPTKNVQGGGRWDNTGTETEAKQITGTTVKEEGVILLLTDPARMFSEKKSDGCNPQQLETDAPADKEVQELKADNEGTVVSEIVKPDKGAEERKLEASKQTNESSSDTAIGTRLYYKNGAVALRGAGSFSSPNGNNTPRRGDLVSFSKTKTGRNIRDIRVVSRSAATLLRGTLVDIVISGSGTEGTAKFRAATQQEEVYYVDLANVVSCRTSILKEGQQVEGVLHDGKIYGICRTCDLYLESKLGNAGRKERPRLNLTVRKEMQDRGGLIMAQSGMAKGPDGTTGFAKGWTKRRSRFAPEGETANESQVRPGCDGEENDGLAGVKNEESTHDVTSESNTSCHDSTDAVNEKTIQ